jgi:beta-lactamase regulating signal transducer with metallopeptidase domain
MSGPYADILFEALANGVWRGVALTLVAALLVRVFKGVTTAAERYAVWMAMLTVIALAPMVEVAWRFMQRAEPAPALMAVEMSPAAAERMLPDAAGEILPRWQAVEVAGAPFVMLWLAVGAFFAVRLWKRCTLASKLKKESIPPDPELAAAVDRWGRDLSAGRIGSTRVSQRLQSPAAVGWLQPAVLLPQSAEEDVHGGDLEMLWMHEQAHVSRRDDWTQLLSECLFAAAWFHPAAYWLRGQLEKDRELACDEAVLDAGVAAHRYAGALGRWAERAALSELPAGVVGLGRSRALIIRRIEMLLSPSRILRRNSGRLAFGASLATAAAAVGLLCVGVPTAIRAQSAVEPDVQVNFENGPVVEVEIVEPVEVTPELTAPVVQTDVRIDVAAPVTALPVKVNPVLLSQAAPPAPPAPASAPAPAAVPGPPAPPAPPAPPRRRDQEMRENARARADEARRWREELRPEIEEIRREAQRMREYVRDSIRPQQERIREAARAMAEEHRRSIEPLAREMAQLGAKMGQAFNSVERDELQRQMEAVAKRIEERQPELQRLQQEMERIEIDMKPFEERLKALGDQLQQKHEALEKARRELEDANQ